MVIDTRNLSFTYPGGSAIFNGVNLAISKGERVALTGPNGAGKSTFMLLIMGVLKGFSGELFVLGSPRREEADFHEVRRRIGLLFQDSDDQLFCPTVEEDIAFGPLNLGLSHDESRRIVDKVTKALGIEHIRGKTTHRLSGGEKRLAALGTVFSMRPDCYLLDEPTAALDSVHTETLLRFLHEHAPTYLVASHDADFLKEAATRKFKLGLHDDIP
jgi:cobalt/nickel transport system ATP-binding protein